MKKVINGILIMLITFSVALLPIKAEYTKAVITFSAPGANGVSNNGIYTTLSNQDIGTTVTVDAPTMDGYEFVCWLPEDPHVTRMTESDCLKELKVEAPQSAEDDDPEEPSETILYLTFHALFKSTTTGKLVEPLEPTDNIIGAEDKDSVTDFSDEFADDEDEIAGKTPANKDSGEVIKVPDTAENKSIILVSVGALIIAIGLGTVLYKLKHEER